MTKIKTSLLKIVGRIKEYMSAICLGIASIMIPLAVAVYFSGDRYMALLWLTMGGVSLAVAVLFTRSEEKKRDEKYSKQLKSTTDALGKVIDEMKQERNENNAIVRNLIEQIRRDRNGQPPSPK